MSQETDTRQRKRLNAGMEVRRYRHDDLLVTLYLAPSVFTPACTVFGAAVIVALMYVILPTIDLILAFDECGARGTERIEFPWKLFIRHAVAGYAPILLGGLGRLAYRPSDGVAQMGTLTYAVLLGSLGLMVIDAGWAL